MEQSDKKDYEIGFLTKEEAGIQKIADVLARNGAEIVLAGPVAKITLAYKIQKEPQAYFGFSHFSAEPQKIKGIDSELKSAPAVLRFLIITPPFVRPKKENKGRPGNFGDQVAPPRQAEPAEFKPPTGGHLSNEALEKKLEEILQ